MAKRYVWMPKDRTTVIDGNTISHGDVVLEKKLSLETLELWVEQGLLGHEIITDVDAKAITVAVNDQVSALLKSAEKKIADLSIANEAVLTENDLLNAENSTLKIEVEALKAELEAFKTTGKHGQDTDVKDTDTKDNPLAPAGKK